MQHEEHEELIGMIGDSACSCGLRLWLFLQSLIYSVIGNFPYYMEFSMVTVLSYFREVSHKVTAMRRSYLQNLNLKRLVNVIHYT